jgi:squalene-hopene/tetraprenyl-beta-curcumene cyclase
LPAAVAGRVDRAVAAALRYLAREQRGDGAWVPLWFGNQHAAEEANPTYGTAKVLIALADCERDAAVTGMVSRGAGYLVGTQNADGGWGGAVGCPSSVEETALALDALTATGVAEAAGARGRAAAWLVRATQGGTRFPVSPIGFYFAKLWYHERTYPLLMTVSALGRRSS